MACSVYTVFVPRVTIAFARLVRRTYACAILTLLHSQCRFFPIHTYGTLIKFILLVSWVSRQKNWDSARARTQFDYRHGMRGKNFPSKSKSVQLVQFHATYLCTLSCWFRSRKLTAEFIKNKNTFVQVFLCVINTRFARRTLHIHQRFLSRPGIWL